MSRSSSTCILGRLLWHPRLRRLTIPRAMELANTNGHLNLGPFSMASHLEGSPIPDISNPGVDRMRPDWSSLRLMGNDTTRAAVLCWYLGKEILTRHPLPTGLLQPQPPYEDEGSPGRCPRTMLRKLLRQGHQAHGAHFRIGFELEFYLLDEPYDPVKHNPNIDDLDGATQQKDRRTYWNTASALRGKHGDCVEACVESLEECGIPVEHFQSKCSSQQYKISLAPQEPVRAADSVIIAAEIIKRVSLRHNLHATFFPTPFSDRTSSGLHTHISIHGVPNSVCPTFLAGMLYRLPLLAAFSMPNAVSFTRLGPPEVCEWVSWGTENRNTAVRQISSNHWEMRIIDFTANIHLALSTFIGAGLLGVRDKAPLLWQDCRGNPGIMDAFERMENGIHDRLPGSLETSLKILNTGFQGLDKLLGAPILEYYRLLRKADMHRQNQIDPKEMERFLAKEF